MDPVIIVGAGITGCVIGRELCRRGAKVILVERDDQVGGLAKTFRYGDFAFDIGPHRFYTQQEAVRRFILDVLKDDYTTIPRRSEVYFFKQYHPWPLRPTVLFRLPASIMLKSAFDLVWMNFRSRRGTAANFEDYILANYGPSLYNVFFKDYTQKFLGLAPRKIHADWAREGMRRTIIDESIASRDLLDILKLFFFFKPLQTEFIYPCRGVGGFCRNLAAQILGSGGEIRTGRPVCGIEHSSAGIEGVYVGKDLVPASQLVWTGSLKDICAHLEVPCGLEYLSLLVFNIILNKPAKRDYQWCYYGSRDLIFSRVSIPPFFNGKMTPAGKGSLCAEVTCRQGDWRWKEPQALVGEIKKDICRVGICDPQDIEEIYVERIADAYPVYIPGYHSDLARIREGLARFDNLTLAGRAGLFWYNNMDESVENGLAVADVIVSKMKLTAQLC